MTHQTEPMFGVDGCTCIPFTRQTNPPRHLKPTDTIDMISGWERGQDCPHHAPAAVSAAVAPPTNRAAVLHTEADRINVAKQQVTEGWQGATEVISDAEVQRLAATGLVGYRQGRGQLLHCLHHKPVPASRWADFHEVTSDDLPDGGICVHPRCGADLLAVQPAAGAQQDGAQP
ncbi:hypothetical protein [Streptomyces werraensis]|uniref:hypothetical protein n=1 Tax=Streptomyces werraensis TaxID=68284 RepID=UPI003440A607